MNSTTGFEGRVGGVIYTDRKEFERAARGLGFTRKGRKSEAKLGTEVRVQLDNGEPIAGQVWSRADRDGYYWLALNNGQCVALHVSTGKVYPGTRSVKSIGRVA